MCAQLLGHWFSNRPFIWILYFNNKAVIFFQLAMGSPRLPSFSVPQSVLARQRRRQHEAFGVCHAFRTSVVLRLKKLAMVVQQIFFYWCHFVVSVCWPDIWPSAAQFLFSYLSGLWWPKLEVSNQVTKVIWLAAERVLNRMSVTIVCYDMSDLHLRMEFLVHSKVLMTSYLCLQFGMCCIWLAACMATFQSKRQTVAK